MRDYWNLSTKNGRVDPYTKQLHRQVQYETDVLIICQVFKGRMNDWEQFFIHLKITRPDEKW